MGLDRDFLSMLTAPVALKRRTGTDSWGNETYGTPTVEKSFIDTTGSGFGSGEQGKQKDKKVVSGTTLLMDALGIQPGDVIAYDSTDHTVTNVDTVKDEFGADLFQTVTVENQKKG